MKNKKGSDLNVLDHVDSYANVQMYFMEFKLNNLYTDSGCNFSLVQKANI